MRKAPATTKTKGSHKDETYMPGITDAADVIQSAGDPEGIALDQAVHRDAHKYIGKTNVADYNVPAGVQLTENLIEEIVEAASRETPEAPVEKE